MLLSEFIRRGTAELENLYPSPEARGMVLILCEEKLGVRNYTHIIEPSYEVPEEALPMMEESIARMCAGEPLQYVLGEAWFCGRTFKVNPDVLIPRPETEQIVREAVVRLLEAGPGARALDLCTGSGCIAWSLALEAPDSAVTAVDISERALSVAASQFPGKGPVFLRLDVLDESGADGLGLFDVLVSNPPYVMEKEKSSMRRNVLDYEPPSALFVPDGDPLLFYRALSVWAGRCLKPGGFGMVEINESLPVETMGIFEDSGFRNVRIMDDFRGRPRFVTFEK